MKKILLILPLILLMLSIAGCKDDDLDDFIVAYLPCPCEEKEYIENSRGYAYLFYDSISIEKEEEFRRKAYMSDDVFWIIYDRKVDSAILYGQIFSSIELTSDICNYPTFAKEWEIPESGKKVYFEGELYAPCRERFGHNIRSVDIILTIFKPE